MERTMGGSTLFHVVVCLLYIVGIYYFDVLLPYPRNSFFKKMFESYGGRYKFLTYLNMLLQCGYFLLALVNDFGGSSVRESEKQTTLQKARDWVFTSLAFPLGTFVTFIFWAIYVLDRELIMPTSMDAWFPSWLNHVMHTLPLVGCVCEQVTIYHRHQRGTKRLFPIFSVYLVYLLWLVFIKYWAGFWVYPVFDALEIKGRIVFLILLSLPALFCYVLGERLHVYVWGLDAAPPSGKKKENKPEIDSFSHHPSTSKATFRVGTARGLKVAPLSNVHS